MALTFVGSIYANYSFKVVHLQVKVDLEGANQITCTDLGPAGPWNVKSIGPVNIYA